MNDEQAIRLTRLQEAIQAQTPPCCWMLDDNGIDLFTVSWQQTTSGEYQVRDFYHWQYHHDTHEMIIVKFAYDLGEHASQSTVLTQARQLVDSYNQQRKKDAGSVKDAFTWHISQQAVMWHTSEQPLITRPQTTIEINPYHEDYQTSPNPRNKQLDTLTVTRHNTLISVWCSSQWVRPYTFTDKHGREWKKMLIIMPNGTQIVNNPVEGWAFDAFLSTTNLERKTLGKDVCLWLDKTKTITLFHSTPTGKETMRVKPWDLANMLREANKIARSQRQQDVEQANHIIMLIQQEYPEQVTNLAKKLHEYQTRGAYDPLKALHTVRRLVNKCLIYYEQTHINPGCMHETDLTVSQSVRLTAASSLLERIVKQTIFHEINKQTIKQTDDDAPTRPSSQLINRHRTR